MLISKANEEWTKPKSVYRIPTQKDAIFKEECCFSCDTPESPDGLFLNLATFVSVGKDFLTIDSEQTRSVHELSSAFYLRTERRHYKNPLYVDQTNAPPFPTDEPLAALAAQSVKLIQLSSHYLVSCEQGQSINEELIFEQREKDELPKVDELMQERKMAEPLARCLVTCISQTGVTNRSDTPGVGLDESDLSVSSVAVDLKQTQGGYGSLEKGEWKCMECGNSRNLWLHLADGFVGCGRRQYGVEDSGCCDGKEGAAIRHWEDDQLNRPMAVKLGTLTSSHSEVYSYNEDKMVLDPLLEEHLLFFGIDIKKLEKTEQTLTDQQLEINKTFQWTKATKSTKEYKLIASPGFVGITNFGSTCYISSVLQILARLERIVNPIVQPYRQVAVGQSIAPLLSDTPCDFGVQLAKVLYALISDRYAKQRQSLETTFDAQTLAFYNELRPSVSVAPTMFRNALVKGHKEFSQLNRQQDAEEFLHYFLEKVEEVLPSSVLFKERLTTNVINDNFTFEVEDCLRPSDNPNMVRKKSVRERVLRLPLLASLTESLSSVLGHKSHVEVLLPGGRKKACSTERTIKTFPNYLIIQLERFLFVDRQETKVTASFEMPLTLNLEDKRAQGLRPGDTLWPEDDDEEELGNHPLVKEILDLGFDRLSATEAVKRLGETATLDTCVPWIMDNQDTIQAQPRKGPGSATKALLAEMGCGSLLIEAAVLECGDNTEAAANWVFQQGMNLSDAQLQEIILKKSTSSTSPTGEPSLPDGPGKYRLVGFVSHLGSSSSSGHYVAHFKNNDQWIIFNDEDVAICLESPPIGQGYLYFYERFET